MGYFYASIPCKRIQSIQLTFFVELCLYCSTISPPDRLVWTSLNLLAFSVTTSVLPNLLPLEKAFRATGKAPKEVFPKGQHKVRTVLGWWVDHFFIGFGWYPIISPKIWGQDVLVFYIHPHTHTQTRLGPENRHSLQRGAFLWMVNWIHPGEETNGEHSKMVMVLNLGEYPLGNEKVETSVFSCAWCSLHR